jgi:hypothetical protein
MAWYRKIVGFLQNALLDKNRFLNAKVLSVLLGKGSKKESSASYVKNGKHT